MIIASIEFATVTQHGDRGWNRTYVPIDISPFIIHPAHNKAVPHHPQAKNAAMHSWSWRRVGYMVGLPCSYFFEGGRGRVAHLTQNNVALQKDFFSYSRIELCIFVCITVRRTDKIKGDKRYVLNANTRRHAATKSQWFKLKFLCEVSL